ncbi:hypothetical protein [Riemerella anatipestifer]|uniref:hypothetical protein n=1 Tax=Riemerella anatipestifer TaxID=34085 RepID=UPI001375144C|nr:hypothetical protein [Riemerella anatipestifer]
MKLKYISVICFLAGVTAYGQVKVNQTISIEGKSNAFLDASENTESKPNSIGRGLLFPQTDLSTFKLDINAADGVNYPTYFDGMIVYNTKEGGSTTDTNIQTTDNLQKGFYYFSNPTGKTNGNITNGKWVKLSDTQANDQLWAQRDNNGVTETYLKPADAKEDLISYKSNRRFSINFGRVADGEFAHQYLNGNQGFSSNEVPFSTTVSSDVLPAASTLGGGNSFFFHVNNSLLKEAHVGANPNRTYFANETKMLAKDVTSNINGLYGVNSSVDFFSNTSASSVIGVSGITSVGSQNGNYTSTKAVNNVGGNFTARNYGTVTNAYGIRAYVNNSGNIDNVTGIQSSVGTQSPTTGTTTIPSHKVKTIKGFDNILAVDENGVVETESIGIRNRNYMNANSTTPVHVGIKNYSVLAENTIVTKLIGEQMSFYVNGSNANITEQYGLLIDNVNKGTDKNYAIYTNEGKVRFGDNVGIGVDAPTEKLEVAGRVKAASFAGTNGATLFPDYVFQKYYTGTSSIKADYSFKTLSQVEDFVKTNGHLPGYQSAAEIKKQGYIDLMATQLTNVEKIEELYLHSIEQEKKIEAQQKQIEELKSLVQQLLNK